ncbi:uncharacterized protein MICPUCDRAFT_56134 [Micromonas pusilla CCMP1545]|uniref:Peroxiredoxin-like 2A n=1 Tax=Micromonas pusilla (strain CCMP1545) TaxID=564608 RepID=C1MP37_MICPC|nr:uncharacterized protein MICPUCDRAFT_56134 [Micromonas pusilla CCMP1545]EEH58398.1 predicted protein [Micromonas pusilla CCMP1545]|eukprot:XP_003056753.1 predicted protein [Micromonas pusilla CCMP1545]
MASLKASAVATKLSELAPAVLTRLPAPTTGAVSKIKASELWQTRPAVVLLHERKAEINDLGCDLVCLLKENIADEVEAFHREPYWSPSTPLYLDEDMTFFKALGGGKVRKGGLSSFFKPGLWKRYGKMDKATKEDANLKGEGTILGGTYVVSKEGVQYQFKEKDFGVAAPLDEIIDACKRAAGK